MKKLLKISIILVIVSIFFINNPILATDSTNIDAQNESSISENSSEDNRENQERTNSNDAKKSTQVSSVVSADEEGLTVSDILSILLIATNIVIILLAIAILVKIK